MKPATPTTRNLERRGAALTDEEIDRLIGRALRDLEGSPARTEGRPEGRSEPADWPEGPRRRTPPWHGLLYLAAFLAGMTVLQGLHQFGGPADTDRGGGAVHRCGTSLTVNPAGSETVSTQTRGGLPLGAL